MADEKKPKEEKQEMLSGTFTASELAAAIKQMADSNQASLKEFAKELAFNITHPEQTDAQKENAKRNVMYRIQRAREEDLMKEDKRKHCVHPARPSHPHRRYGVEWGMFNGTSVIAWHYTTISKRTEAGGSTDGIMVALGVCQWCGSEFKPEDPDYQDIVGLGLSTAVGTYPMNQRTGVWS
jgi:prolyl-tRNA synthetase